MEDKNNEAGESSGVLRKREGEGGEIEEEMKFESGREGGGGDGQGPWSIGAVHRMGFWTENISTFCCVRAHCDPRCRDRRASPIWCWPTPDPMARKSFSRASQIFHS